MRRREFIGLLGASALSPGDIPMGAVHSFPYDLKTTKALKLKIPPTLLASADEVIE